MLFFSSVQGTDNNLSKTFSHIKLAMHFCSFYPLPDAHEANWGCRTVETSK